MVASDGTTPLSLDFDRMSACVIVSPTSKITARRALLVELAIRNFRITVAIGVDRNYRRDFVRRLAGGSIAEYDLQPGYSSAFR